MARTDLKSEQLFEELFHEYYTPICRRIFRIVRDEATAEDLGQLVFIKYWKKELLRSEGHIPGAYLYRMAVNEAISYLRKNEPVLQALDDDLPLPEPADNTQAIDYSEASLLHEALWNAVDRLPRKCQMIFRLCKSEGLTYSEISEHLNISEKTVENQMGKAFKYLRDELRHLSPIAFIFLGLYH